METIQFRQKRTLWWLVLACVLLGGFFLVCSLGIAADQPKSSPWPIFIIIWPFAGFLFWGAVCIALSLLREEIIADSAGLRWRGVFAPWKETGWEEISDFYLLGQKTRFSPVQTSPSVTVPTIQTPQGKLTLSSYLANRADLMEIVAERAVNAPTREWEIWEFRAAQNFSQRFNYWTKSQQWTAPAITGLLIFCVISISPAIVFSSRSKPAVPLEPFWLWHWLPLGLGTTFFGFLAAVYILMMVTIWRERHFAQSHRNEWVEITPRGMRWSNGQSEIYAAWNEISAIRFVPETGLNAHYHVETPNGDFKVWRALENRVLWLEYARYFAPHLAVEAPVVDPDLGNEAATWSGGRIGVGDRVFHFRTRDTRMVLCAASAFFAVIPLLPFLMHAMKTPDDEPSPFPYQWWLAGLICGVLISIYGWICFARAAIWADENGIEWRVPLWKPRRVRYQEIESFGRDDGGYYLTVAAKKRRLFLFSAPARPNELLELIKKCATNATGKWN